MKFRLSPPIYRNIEEHSKYKWITFGFLIVLFVIGAIAGIPHSRAVIILTEGAEKIPPIGQSIISNAGVGLIFGSLFIWIGLWLAPKVNLGTPLIAQKLSGKSIINEQNKQILLSTVLIGIFIGAIMLVLLKVQAYVLPLGEAKARHPSAIPSFFASFSAGITEEIIFRLGIMSMVIAIIQYIFKSKLSSQKTIWTGNILTALLFGIIHIPMSSNYFDQTPLVTATIIIANIITGTSFGWIFWRYGLIMVMLAHFISDIVLHVIGSPFG